MTEGREKSQKKLWGVLFPIGMGILFSVALAISLSMDHSAIHRDLVDGVFHYDDLNIEKSTKLEGEWRFYWNRFLISSDGIGLDDGFFEEGVLVPIPSRFSKGTGVSRYEGGNRGYASYAIRMELPDESQSKDLAVYFPPMEFAYRLYYKNDGENVRKLGQVGHVNSEGEGSGRSRQGGIYRLDFAKSGFMILEVSNYEHLDANFNRIPHIGEFETLRANTVRELSFTQIINGVNLTLMIMVLIRFLFRRDQKANLYLFFLFSAFLIYNLGHDGQIYWLWPELTENRESLSIFLAYMGLSLGSVGFLGYTHYSVSNHPPKRFYPLMVGAVVLTILTFILPSYQLSLLTNLFQMILLLALFEGFLVDINLNVEKKSAKMMLFAHASLGSSLVIAILANMGLFPDISFLVPVASMVFAFSLTHASALVDSEIYHNEKHLRLSLQDEVKKQTKSLEAKTVQSRNLLRVVSHDIRNPLTVIMGNVDILMSRIDSLEPDRAIMMLSKTHKAASEITSILRHAREMDALDSGKASLKLSKVNVKQVVNTVQENFAARLEKKQLRLKIQNGISDELHVLAEETSLCHNVLANLVSNSIKFSPSGTDIELEVEENSEGVMIKISDHGIGIPEDIKEKLFDPFAQTNRAGTDGEDGTGFGMPIVKSYMEHYKGSIEVHSTTKEESDENSGTEFSLYFKKSA